MICPCTSFYFLKFIFPGKLNNFPHYMFFPHLSFHNMLAQLAKKMGCTPMCEIGSSKVNMHVCQHCDDIIFCYMQPSELEDVASTNQA